VEFTGNDGEGRRSSREALNGTSEEESSTRCSVHRGRGGAGGRMISGSNEQRSRPHGKANQGMCQVKEVVERGHPEKKKDGQEVDKEKKELGGGCPGEG